MKVLIVNKFYYPRGGDCICAMMLEEMLRKRGHITAVFAMDYPLNVDSEFKCFFAPQVAFEGGIANKLRAAQRIFGGAGVKRAFARMLDAFMPDVVHFHNIHSYLSPIIVEMAHRRGIRTVWSMHDFKLVCPAYNCLSQGPPCEECIGASKRNVLSNRCMKGSRVASALAWLEAVKWSPKRLQDATDVFVCPSVFMAQKMKKGGFDDKKIAVICNPVDPKKVDGISVSLKRNDYYAYVGRLSHEKGVETLLKAAVTLPYPLKIAGGGPLEQSLRERFGKCPTVEFLGMQDASQVKQLLQNARFSVAPSECYENNPLSVIESLSLGTPVVGARIGGIPELIEPGNGFLFRSGSVDSLANNIAVAWESPFEYNNIAEKAKARFSEESFITEILKAYSL